MGTVFGELNGALTVQRGSIPMAETDCFKCKHAFVTPSGNRTVVMNGNSISYIHNGKGVFCTDDSTDKSITMYGDGIVCSKFEPKKET